MMIQSSKWSPSRLDYRYYAGSSLTTMATRRQNTVVAADTPFKCHKCFAKDLDDDDDDGIIKIQTS
jgi:hypothetical protein